MVQINRIPMVLYGASGHAKVIVDILEANDIKIDYIVDDNPEITDFLGYEVRRNTGKYEEAIISIGSSEIRKRVSESIKVERYLTVVHPTSVISPRASVAEGSVVMQGTIIQSCAQIGRHCIINTGASVDHDCRISDFVHIAPQAVLSGNVEVGECSWIGVGAVVKQGIRIGRNCMVGAGAVVVKNVPDGATVVGVPAREI